MWDVGDFLPYPGSFSPTSPTTKEETVFDKTKDKVNTLVNDRVAAPIRTSVLIACCAFIMAGIALMLVVSRGND